MRQCTIALLLCMGAAASASRLGQLEGKAAGSPFAYDLSSPESAETKLADAAGDDWGDAVLGEVQNLATSRLKSQNKALRAQLAALEKRDLRVKSAQLEVRLKLAGAKRLGEEMDRQLAALRKVNRMEKMASHRLGSAATRANGTKLTAHNGVVETKNVTKPVAKAAPKAPQTFSEELLNDALNTGKSSSKVNAGAFCTDMQNSNRLSEKDCSEGSVLQCNSYYQYCEIVKNDGNTVQIEPEVGCAAGGIRTCEKGREMLEANMWMKSKKKREAAEYKRAMAAAWQTARYRARYRKKADAASRVEGKKALAAAAAEGDKQVKIATLLGNAYLPEPEKDKEEKSLKADIKKNKNRLVQMEQIFTGLRHVSPQCDSKYVGCGKACSKAHPMSLMKEAVSAIMGKVTKCQLKCKQDVADCVMQMVSTTYKNITMAATAASAKASSLPGA